VKRPSTTPSTVSDLLIDDLCQRLRRIQSAHPLPPNDERRHGGDHLHTRLPQQILCALAVLPFLERALELFSVQADFSGNATQHLRFADVFTALEECREERVGIFIALAMFLRELHGFVRQACVRLRRHAWELHLQPELLSQRIDVIAPRTLQIIVFGTQRRRGLRTQLEGQPLESDVLPSRGFFQRDLRQEAVRSNKVGEYSDR